MVLELSTKKYVCNICHESYDSRGELPVFMKEKNGTSIWNTHLSIDKIFGELTE